MAWTLDQELGVVAIAVSGTGVLITVALAIRQRRRKLLGCESWPSSKLITIAPEMADRFKVTFDGNPVADPHWSAVRIRNVGQIEVLQQDFEQAIRLRSGATILSANVFGMKPAELTPTIVIEREEVRVEPMLLNPGDEFFVSVVTDGNAPKLSWKGRIVGGQLRELYRGPPRFLRWVGYTLLVAPPAILAAKMVASAPEVTSPIRSEIKIGVLVLLALVVLGIVAQLLISPRAWWSRRQ